MTSFRRTKLRISLLAVTALLGCSGATTESIDTSICPQTYEFGNYGCGDIRGRVLIRTGGGLAGAYVVAYLVGSTAQTSALVMTAQTDTAGYFAMRGTWYVPSGLPGGQRPDSAVVWVRATLPLPGVRPIIADSVRVLARFAAVNATAPSVTVPAITLAFP